MYSIGLDQLLDLIDKPAAAFDWWRFDKRAERLQYACGRNSPLLARVSDVEQDIEGASSRQGKGVREPRRHLLRAIIDEKNGVQTDISCKSQDLI